MVRQLQPGISLVMRWLASLLLLGVVFLLVDTATLLNQLSQIHPGFVLIALAVTLMQVALSAWRWRYTSGRLGLALGLKTAIGEYYLATCLNQLLPGGVMGDVNRAWRQAHNVSDRLAAANAVVIERLSGQVVLLFLTMGLLALLWPFPAGAPGGQGWNESGNIFALAGVLALLLLAIAFRQPLASYLLRFGNHLRLALLSWPAAVVQTLTSTLVVASYLLVFMLLAEGLAGDGAGLALAPDWQKILPLAAALLMAMSLPVTVAGWGVREGAAALLWPMAGLPAEQGVLLSVTYGLVVLLSSLPGALVLVIGSSDASDPGRTTYPNPD